MLHFSLSIPAGRTRPRQPDIDYSVGFRPESLDVLPNPRPAISPGHDTCVQYNLQLSEDVVQGFNATEVLLS